MGVQKGDRVTIHSPMIPELRSAAMPGNVPEQGSTSVVFAGFSSNALSTRINEARVKIVITSDGSYRGQQSARPEIPLLMDEALIKCSC